MEKVNGSTPARPTTSQSRFTSRSCSRASACAAHADPRRAGEHGDALSLGDLVVAPSSRQVTRGGERVDLQKRQYDLLE
jgi:DNA-binding response OmpR family regulator